MDTEHKLVEKIGNKETWLEILQIIIGCCLLATGIYFFQFPNHFAIGGVTGISIILNTFFKNISPGTFVLVINSMLLVLGFIVFGRSFTIKTVFASLLMSSLLRLLESVVPISAPLTDDPLLELVFGVTVPAIGSAILFNNVASSGGTDIIAMILKKFTAVDIGNALLFTDLIIASSTFLIFNVKTGMLCVTGLFIKAIVIDMVFDNFKTKKCFQIITNYPEPIVDVILKMSRGATVTKAQGAFTHEDKYIVLTVVSRIQAAKLRSAAKAIDPHCFVFITTTTDIIGKGFRSYN